MRVESKSGQVVTCKGPKRDGHAIPSIQSKAATHHCRRGCTPNCLSSAAFASYNAVLHWASRWATGIPLLPHLIFAVAGTDTIHAALSLG